MRADRAAVLERLAGRFDLLVVGGGIAGARVAYEAALAGLRVALVEAGDFGGGTSSASSNFVHGGLRYLASGHVRLVRAALHERQILQSRVAPHLVRRMPVLLAIQHERLARPPILRGGLLAYRALGGGHESPRVVSAEDAHRLVPALPRSGARDYVLLQEAQTHDARLTLATVTAATEAGAVVLNHATVCELHVAHGRVAGATVAVEGVQIAVTCRAAVNATGAAVDRVRRLEDRRSKPIARLSKGVHVVLPLDAPRAAAVASFGANRRTAFAAPWHGMLLVGTTDTAFDEDPATAAPTPADVAALFAQAAPILAPELLEPHCVRYAYAGLRVLPRGKCDTAVAPRDHVIATGAAGVVSVAGGKLTTHRRIAADVLRRLPPEVRPRRVAPSQAPLPGSERPQASPPAELDRETRDHLLALYGARAAGVVAAAESAPQALERIHPAAPDIWAQVIYAREREWAVLPEDVTRRRTSLAVRGLEDEVRPLVAAALGSPSLGHASSVAH